MKIRLTGTRAETAHAATVLTALATDPDLSTLWRVREVSRFYPNHDSDHGRVYLDIELREVAA